MHTSSQPVNARIFRIRDQRVIIDNSLARIYGVPTKRFNEAFKRNRHRFPEDFAFQLTREEWVKLETQDSDPVRVDDNLESSEVTEGKGIEGNWSQFATSSKAKYRGAAYRPWVFTEHGALMAANILRSDRAIEMSVYVVRAFVKQREALAANATILKRLAEIDRTLLEHDEALKILWHRLQPLLAPSPEPPRRKIGFHAGNG